MTNPARALQAVVFDLDGLLFNTEELYQLVGAEILRRRGCDFTQELLDAMMGRPSAAALQLMIDWHGLDASIDELRRETRELFPPILDARLAPMPGAAALLGALERAGRPRGIATSSGRRFLNDVLRRVDWQDRFDFVLTSEDVVEGKPHPEIYHKAAAGLGLPAEAVMVLEDSQNGCRAAVAAGTYAVAVPGSHSVRHDFSGAKFVAESLADRRIYAALQLSTP